MARELGQMTEKKRQHTAFVRARLWLVALFIGFWASLYLVGYAMPYGFLVVLAAEAAALASLLAGLRNVRTVHSLDRMHQALLACELVAHSAIFYFLGGVSWLGGVAYFYALLYGVVFLTWRQAALFAAAVCAAFLVTVTLDSSGFLPHQWYLPQGADRYQDPEFLAATSVSFVGVIATITLWMVFIGSELRHERDVALRTNEELVKTQQELQLLNQELETKVAERTRVLAFRAEHDQLTGLLNRGSVTRRAQDSLALAQRSQQPLTVIVADGDNFKTCNDKGGHVYGDQVLRILADTLKESCRETDVVGRLGGDEFLIVLPNTAAVGALRYCRRLLRLLQQKQRDCEDESLPVPALSLGVAVFPQHGVEMEELIRVADKAMYDAKAEGGARWKVGTCGATFGAQQRLPSRRPAPAPLASTVTD